MAAVLGAVLIVLTPLAHGSPIDPSSPGFWDNGDFDDVILFLTSDPRLLDTGHRPSIRASEWLPQSVSERLAGAEIHRTYEPAPPRAPPSP